MCCVCKQDEDLQQFVEAMVQKLLNQTSTIDIKKTLVVKAFLSLKSNFTNESLDKLVNLSNNNNKWKKSKVIILVQIWTLNQV